MQRTVRQYVSGRAFCQTRKTGRTLPIGPMESGPAPTEPFGYWRIDHLEPFPKTDGGNRYLLVFIEEILNTFRRKVMRVPTRTTRGRKRKKVKRMK